MIQICLICSKKKKEGQGHMPLWKRYIYTYFISRHHLTNPRAIPGQKCLLQSIKQQKRLSDQGELHMLLEKSREKDKKKPGNDLLSHRRAAVPSARERFTYVFGMGTCISTPLWSPGRFTVIEDVSSMESIRFGTETTIWSSLTAH